jgi:hypothetical protein
MGHSLKKSEASDIRSMTWLRRQYGIPVENSGVLGAVLAALAVLCPLVLKA